MSITKFVPKYMSIGILADLGLALSPNLIPLTKEFSLTGDFHARALSACEESFCLESGLGASVSLQKTEFQLVGLDLHCEGGVDDCELAYKIGAYFEINEDLSCGVFTGFSDEGFSSLRTPCSWRGFAIVPSIHVEDEVHKSLELSAVWGLGNTDLGPLCSLSTESLHCGLTIRNSTAHPH